MTGTTMALVTVSNSLCAPNFTERVYCGRSSHALNFNPLNSGFTSTVYGARSELSVADSFWSGKVGKHCFSQRRSPASSLLERPTIRCNAGSNASSTPESQTTEKEVDSSSSEGPSAQSHLELLHQITSESSLGSAGSRKTIAQQLAQDVEMEEAEEVSVRLGNGKVDINSGDLTISQKRNIRRQKYLNKVSERNDAPFFTAVALFVLVPPVAILGVAAATGYIDLFP